WFHSIPSTENVQSGVGLNHTRAVYASLCDAFDEGDPVPPFPPLAGSLSPSRAYHTCTATGSAFQSNWMASTSSEKYSLGCVRNSGGMIPNRSRALSSPGMSNHM